MAERPGPDYSAFDRPELLSVFFHPRPDTTEGPTAGGATDLMIPVAEGIRVAARFHPAEKGSPTILFFHGNGEIVSDYDDLAPLYGRMGINFLAADYRGYGRSEGIPTVTAMMTDCHAVLDFARDWLAESGYHAPLIVMGRSIGSAPALELAAGAGQKPDGLIIESGFAHALPLLRLLGADTAGLHGLAQEGLSNLAKIARVTMPTLVIHAEHDHIIPYSDGTALHDHCPAEHKRLVKIPGADHNTLLAYGLSDYMNAVRELVHAVIP